jgi:hypothetical protein
MANKQDFMYIIIVAFFCVQPTPQISNRLAQPLQAIAGA